MKNVLRTLIYGEQISLTLLDATQTVNEAIRLHALSRPAAILLGKTLAVMTYMSACLKEKTGEVSVSVKGNGAGGGVCVSGDYALHLRGYIEDAHVPSVAGETDEEAELRCLGRSGTLTIVRDNGYSRPFVGACAFPAAGGVDEAFEEYYRVSEQLPTHIASEVRLDESGACAFAGAAVLQPLPFADAETLERLPSRARLKKITGEISSLGLKKCAEIHFSAKEELLNAREAAYKCHCSKEYLAGVLVSLGKAQLEDILKTDGKIEVHCHYCNKDYRFTQEDVEKLFP